MKCEDKKCKIKKCVCKESLNHLSKIEGQIKSLKKRISEGENCEKVFLLTKSISKSFDSLKTKTLKNFLKNEILNIKKITKKQEEKIDKIFNLYKK
jgi:DNA-binding FrmR family transcriptional regulator